MRSRVDGSETEPTEAARVKLYGSDESESVQREHLTSGNVPVAVYGLGKMGLPLAAVYAERTGAVRGVDIDPEVVEAVNRGDCPVQNEPGLPELVAESVGNGSLAATTSGPDAAARASVHVVIVPTFVTDDGHPDLSALRAAVRDVGAGLEAGDLVVVESTVPPRTCREVVLPTLLDESGLDADAFGVAFCPERTSSGRAIQDIQGAYPKVVGGIDDESTRVAELVYDVVSDNDVIPVSDVTTAECVKVFEGVYRDVNIALANELARLGDALDGDVVEAIEVANTQPFCDIHTPGIGVGGHCIPYYPQFLVGEYGTETPLMHTAREVNDGMPDFGVEKLRELLEARGVDDVGGAAVLVLGLAYRAGVAETRKSPAIPIVEQLSDWGTTVHVADPVLDDETVESFGATPVSVGGVADLDLDGVVLVTDHDEFDGIDWDAFDDLAVVDGRQALDLAGSGHAVYTIGRGDQ